MQNPATFFSAFDGAVSSINHDIFRSKDLVSGTTAKLSNDSDALGVSRNLLDSFLLRQQRARGVEQQRRKWSCDDPSLERVDNPMGTVGFSYEEKTAVMIVLISEPLVKTVFRNGSSTASSRALSLTNGVVRDSASFCFWIDFVGDIKTDAVS